MSTPCGQQHDPLAGDAGPEHLVPDRPGHRHEGVGVPQPAGCAAAVAARASRPAGPPAHALAPRAGLAAQLAVDLRLHHDGHAGRARRHEARAGPARACRGRRARRGAGPRGPPRAPPPAASGTCPSAPVPRAARARTRMPSSCSSAGQAGSARRVTTVAASPAATRAAPSRRTWVSPPPSTGWNDSARKRTRVNGPRPRAAPRSAPAAAPARRRSACPGSRARCARGARPSGRS